MDVKDRTLACADEGVAHADEGVQGDLFLQTCAAFDDVFVKGET